MWSLLGVARVLGSASCTDTSSFSRAMSGSRASPVGARRSCSNCRWRRRRMNRMMRTVLLVEDEPDLLLATRLILEDAGYAVIEASGGATALELVKNRKVDAVFLDLRMPGFDGWTVLEDLQADSHTSHLPVIVVSAQADPSAVKRSVELGAAGYVRKPFRAADLTQALEDALE